MLRAASRDQFELWVVALRAPDFAPSCRQLLLCQVRAFEKPGEVARAQDYVTVNQMHVARPSRVELYRRRRALSLP